VDICYPRIVKPSPKSAIELWNKARRWRTNEAIPELKPTKHAGVSWSTDQKGGHRPSPKGRLQCQTPERLLSSSHEVNETQSNSKCKSQAEWEVSKISTAIYNNGPADTSPSHQDPNTTSSFP